MKRTYCIGIDIGTGSTKAVSVDITGKAFHTEQVSYPTLSSQPGLSEQAPELIWQAFVKCISRTIKFNNEVPYGIALSSAMHSLIPADPLGQPLMNMITWADNRSASIAEQVRVSSLGEVLYEQTGTPIHAMSPLCKIIWLRENEPALFKQTHKFISIKEYIWFRLFGVFEADYSIASATGLFDIEKLRWNDNALDLCQITTAKLSTPVSTNHQRTGIDKSLQEQTGLTASTSFLIGASDGCMASLGSLAMEPGVAALTIGTSGAIRVAGTKPTYNFKAMTFNYWLDDHTFISGGPINNGGAVLKWYAQSFLKKPLTSADDYNSILQELNDTPPGAEGLLFLPYLFGERAPVWNSEACGVFFGINNHHTQAHFTRSVIEGISMALYNIGAYLEESGLPFHEINVSGGFIHSPAWVQIMADIFGKPIAIIGTEDASAVGAAYLSFKTNGYITGYDSLKPTAVKKFLPREESHLLYRDKVFPL
ncbi:MAG TPA: gluconokinase, partial [Ohtaekwangia sp.]